MTKQELIKRFEENADGAMRSSESGVGGILAAAYEQEAAIWRAAAMIAANLDPPEPEEPVKKRRRIQIECDSEGWWRSSVWEECDAGVWERLKWESSRCVFASDAAREAEGMISCLC